MITDSDMMIDGDTAIKTEVLYVTGCRLVTLRRLRTLQIVVTIIWTFNATFTKVTTDGMMKHNHKISNLHHHNLPIMYR